MATERSAGLGALCLVSCRFGQSSPARGMCNRHVDASIRQAVSFGFFMGCCANLCGIVHQPRRVPAGPGNRQTKPNCLRNGDLSVRTGNRRDHLHLRAAGIRLGRFVSSFCLWVGPGPAIIGGLRWELRTWPFFFPGFVVTFRNIRRAGPNGQGFFLLLKTKDRIGFVS